MAFSHDAPPLPGRAVIAQRWSRAIFLHWRVDAARLAPLKARGLFPDYPFGHDFTDIELALSRALPGVKTLAARTPKWRLLWRALRAGRPDPRWQPHLARMQLQQPRSLQDKVVVALLTEALSRQA